MLRRCARFCVILMSSLTLTALLSPTLANGSLFSPKPRNIQLASATTPSRNSASLFKAAGGGFFAAPKRTAPTVGALDQANQMGKLRHLIQTAESRHKGYDAVQLAAKIKPGKRPTQMTIAEIYSWIKKTPKQHHAIGRYQFIPETLRRLVKKRGLSHQTRFSPRVQDQLADILLLEAGLEEFQNGDMTRHAFMKKLAKIWAGFPTSTGKSYYHGKAGNKASITWATFDAEMAKIFPS